MIGTGLATVAAVAGAAALVHVYRRDRDRIVAHRRRAFENCHGILTQAELVQERGDYPTLLGRRDGHPVELKLLADNIAVRKLPVLWLFITVRRPLAVPGTLDVMLRPQNTEYFSPHGRLPDWLPTPPEWPDQAVIRGRGRLEMSRLLDRLKREAAHFRADNAAKELLVGPGGVRLTWFVDQGARSDYLAFRQASFTNDILPRDLVEKLVRRAMSLCDELSRETSA